jgi:hypothetical protein
MASSRETTTSKDADRHKTISQAKRNDQEEVSLFGPQNGLDNGSTAMNSTSERAKR